MSETEKPRQDEGPDRDFPDGVEGAIRFARLDVEARAPAWRTTRRLLAEIEQLRSAAADRSEQLRVALRSGALVGRCGNTPPRSGRALAEIPVCALPHGHAGFHADDRGGSWGQTWRDAETPAGDDENWTRTEWAVWFDTDHPTDPGADVRGEASYLLAQRRIQEYLYDDLDDSPKGVCCREVRHIAGPWKVDRAGGSAV